MPSPSYVAHFLPLLNSHRSWYCYKFENTELLLGCRLFKWNTSTWNLHQAAQIDADTTGSIAIFLAPWMIHLFCCLHCVAECRYEFFMSHDQVLSWSVVRLKVMRENLARRVLTWRLMLMFLVILQFLIWWFHMLNWVPCLLCTWLEPPQEVSHQVLYLFQDITSWSPHCCHI